MIVISGGLGGFSLIFGWGRCSVCLLAAVSMWFRVRCEMSRGRGERRPAGGGGGGGCYTWVFSVIFSASRFYSLLCCACYLFYCCGGSVICVLCAI